MKLIHVYFNIIFYLELIFLLFFTCISYFSNLPIHIFYHVVLDLYTLCILNSIYIRFKVTKITHHFTFLILYIILLIII